MLTVFQLADGEFDHGVFAVEPVGFDRGQVVAVGDEAVVPPLGEQASLGSVSQSCPAHDETHDAPVLLASTAALVDGFGDLGEPAEGVVDVNPRVIRNARGGGFDLGLVGDGDRPGHAVPVEGAE